MKPDIPANDCREDDFFHDEIEGPLDEEFAPWRDTAGDSGDTNDTMACLPVEDNPNWPQSGASSPDMDNLTDPMVEDRDPVHFLHEGPSSQCRSRVQDDMVDLFENPLPFVNIQAVGISRFHVWTADPSGTPDEGGFFHFFLQCPPDYPMRPSRVRLLNLDDGSLNPKLPESGKVCLDILGTTDTSTWSLAHNIKSTLVVIQSC